MIPNEVQKHLKDVLPLARGLMEEAEFAGLISNMRRHEAQARIDIVLELLDNLPQPPEPDWSQAPDWAQWWAVDADGTAVWYEAEPFVSDPFMWDWNYTPHTQNKIDKILHIPIGIDWRTTLRRRPQPEQPHD